MKTSNKIITALFILPSLLIVFIWGSLYAKLKNNDYITEKQLYEENTVHHKLAPFSNIRIDGHEGNVTVEYADSFAINRNKFDKDIFVFEVKENTLYVTTKRYTGDPLKILCPSFEKLYVDSSSVHIDSMKLSGNYIELGTYAYLSFNAQADSLSFNIAKGSTVKFEKTAIANVLNLQMEDEAVFEKNAGLIKQIGAVKLQDDAKIRVDGKTMQLIWGKK